MFKIKAAIYLTLYIEVDFISPIIFPNGGTDSGDCLLDCALVCNSVVNGA